MTHADPVAQLTHIWRHPIKSHGREALGRVTLSARATMPWDRRWAVAHEQAKTDGTEWAPCANFSRGSKAPVLMAINASANVSVGIVTLTHPNRPDLTFDPDTQADLLLDWVRPLMPEYRAASARIVRVPRRGMTESDFPSVSNMNLATHHAVEQELGRPLDIRHWRGNLWLDGLAPWQEFEWLDRDITIGDVVLRPRERIERCMATTANPDTGLRDADTQGTLDTWGQRDFGLRAELVTCGTLRLGDGLRL